MAVNISVMDGSLHVRNLNFDLRFIRILYIILDSCAVGGSWGGFNVRISVLPWGQLSPSALLSQRRVILLPLPRLLSYETIFPYVYPSSRFHLSLSSLPEQAQRATILSLPNPLALHKRDYLLLVLESTGRGCSGYRRCN